MRTRLQHHTLLLLMLKLLNNLLIMLRHLKLLMHVSPGFWVLKRAQVSRRIEEMIRWSKRKNLRITYLNMIEIEISFTVSLYLAFWRSIPLCICIVNSCAWTFSLLSDINEKPYQENRIKHRESLTRWPIDFQRRLHSHLMLVLLESETSSLANILAAGTICKILKDLSWKSFLPDDFED